jgi:hypothetical protein
MRHRIAVRRVNSRATPALARVHSWKNPSRFLGAGQRVTGVSALPVARGPQDASRRARFGPLHGDRPALRRGQRPRPPRAQPVAHARARARVARRAGRPQVAQVVTAAQDDGDDVIDAVGVGTAAPALPALDPEHLGADPPPARRPRPRTAHDPSVAANRRSQCQARATPGLARKPSSGRGGESREIPGSRPRRPARRVCVRPLISGREKILAGPGVVADHRRRTAIRWSSGQPSGMVDQQTGWSISDRSSPGHFASYGVSGAGECR